MNFSIFGVKKARYLHESLSYNCQIMNVLENKINFMQGKNKTVLFPLLQLIVRRAREEGRFCFMFLQPQLWKCLLCSKGLLLIETATKVY